MTQKEQENLHYKEKNIIRISNAELNKPIYRVFSKRWLIDALTKKKNTLVKPSMWDDPFENFIFKSTVQTNQGELALDTIRENYYGQCWTLTEEETDALWRIYSPNKDGFRVKTTIGKIFDAFYNLSDKWAMIAFYVGKIQYEEESNIKAYFENPDNLNGHLFDTSGNGQVETLLIKRLEFKHENELRLIFSTNKENYDVSQMTYEFPIDINFHFDEILADPRMEEDDFVQSVKDIKNLGYTNTIRKSQLYQIPNLNLQLTL